MMDDIKRLAEIQHELKTQDNHITSHPIFVVQQKIGNRYVWVHTFLTEKGAKDYIRNNNHNLNLPIVYVASGYGNPEWQLMRRVPELVEKLVKELDSYKTVRPYHEWHDDDGMVLWYFLPVREPAFFVGTPNDSDWPWGEGETPESEIGWARAPNPSKGVA